MVIGMSIFQKYFAKYSDSFTILGGAACDEWFSQASLGFRATKDIDVVLILEAKNIAFFEQLWRFLKDGSYRNWQRSDGTKSFFRFLSPDNQDFPQMIEILARPELVVNVPAGQVIVPIHIDDDISSLSAILLDEDYYHLILNNRRISDSGLPFVIPSALILLKAKAYLNLIAMRDSGKHIKGDDLRKHRNDIFRLSYLLIEGDGFQAEGSVINDLKDFLACFPVGSSEWQGIQDALRKSRLEVFSIDVLLGRISNYFGL